MRLGVEAALVAGRSFRATSCSTDGVDQRGRCRGRRPGYRRAGIRRPPGERVCRRRPSRRRSRRGTTSQATLSSRPASRPTCRRSSPPREDDPSLRFALASHGPRDRAFSARTSKGRSSPRGGSDPPPASRRDPDLELLDRLLGAGPVRLLTLAPSSQVPWGCRPPAGARHRGLSPATATRRLPRRQRGVRPRRSHRHPRLQRDAPVLPS